MLSEIWSATDIIFYHFVPFFCPFTLLTTWKIKILKNEKSMEELSHYTCVPQMTIIWCMVPEIWSTRHNFLSLFGYVLLFYAPNNLENQNFEKMKKYTKNHDHMPYCSWDMVRDECNCYFSFWAIFPFYPRNSPRNQNLKKKRKKRLEISFYTSVPKIMIRHTVLEIRRATDERTDKRKKWHIEVGAHLKNRFGRPSLSQCFFPECPKW